MSFKIKIDAGDFTKALQENRKKTKRELRKALKTSGTLVEAEAKRNCPRQGWPLGTHSVYKVTGELRRTIRSKVMSFRKVRILAGGTGKTNYAKWVHNGTRLMPPRPFLKKGLVNKEKDIKTLISNALYKALKLD